MRKNAHQKAGTLYLIHVLTHATRARLGVALAELGLSAFQYTILNVVAGHAGLSSSQLSRHFHVTPQAMGELILGLERRGFVKRQEDPANRKTLQLSLTPHGQKAVAAGNKIRSQLEKYLFAKRTVTEMQQFRAILDSALDLLRQNKD